MESKRFCFELSSKMCNEICLCIFCCIHNKKRVLITGFSSFQGHKFNPSWQGVKNVAKGKIERDYNIKLLRKKIDVVYKYVDKFVPELWDQFKPDLVIHVGVSDATSFVLETQANKSGYKYRDNAQSLPKDFQNISQGPEKITTGLDVQSIIMKFNSDPPGNVRAEISNDAGKYLCEYIYYTSLSRGSSTLFVHVPLEIYTFKQIAQGLERIIELCLEQI